LPNFRCLILSRHYECAGIDLGCNGATPWATAEK
jgi:hypothetical protein